VTFISSERPFAAVGSPHKLY